MRAAIVALLSASACTDGASADPGLDAILQVGGAQYRPGAFPSDDGGPLAVQLSPGSSQLAIDQFMGSARGVFAEGTRSAVVGIDGYTGAWLVPTRNPDIDTPDQPVARFSFAVTRELPPGPFVLRIAGANELGRFGASATTMIVAAEVPPPDGELVFGLVWTGPADLDIHVVDALGGEAWSDKPNTLTPISGSSSPPGEWMNHGILDHDGNKDCVQHARPSEHVIWTVPPPGGRYIVRVDTVAMCGAASAAWYVEAYRNGELRGAARGVSTPEDVINALDTFGLGRAGAGVTALELTL